MIIMTEVIGRLPTRVSLMSCRLRRATSWSDMRITPSSARSQTARFSTGDQRRPRLDPERSPRPLRTCDPRLTLGIGSRRRSPSSRSPPDLAQSTVTLAASSRKQQCRQADTATPPMIKAGGQSRHDHPCLRARPITSSPACRRVDTPNNRTMPRPCRLGDNHQLTTKQGIIHVCHDRTSRLIGRTYVRRVRTLLPHIHKLGHTSPIGPISAANGAMFECSRIAWDSEPRNLSLAYLPEGL